MSRKTDRRDLRLRARLGELPASSPSLKAASARERSKAILGLGRPGYWTEETRLDFEAACRRPLDLSVRERSVAEGLSAVCDAFVKGLACADGQAALALWRSAGARFQSDQARQFIDLGGLTLERAERWEAGFRKEIFEALCDALPEREVWEAVRQACGWPQSADGERERPARWILGAGLRVAGMAQRQNVSPEAPGALAEMARAAISRWGHELSPAEIKAWTRLAKASPPSGPGQRSNAQEALMESASKPSGSARAICEALKEAGLFGEIDARYLAARSQNSRSSGWQEALWREPARPGEGLHPAWKQWGAPQGPEAAAEGFEALLSLEEWPGARAPKWRALRAAMSPSALSFGAGLALWLGELGEMEGPLGKEWLIAEPGSGAQGGASLPAELIEKRDERGFERLARLLAQKGLVDERWPTVREGERSIAEMTAEWGAGRSAWDRAGAEAAAGPGPARAPRARL